MTIAIVDSYNLLFRAYYALPSLTNKQGMPTGAVYGFLTTLIRYIKNRKPNQLIVATDTGKTNFRHEIYPKYKANRQEAPQDLIPQFEIIKETLNTLGITLIGVDGYEADDIISTLVKYYDSCEILSSDKDLIQLISNSTVIYEPFKNHIIDQKYVIEKFAITPNKFLDYLSLTGDASDNIPGVPGIGPKTASKLLDQFQSLEGIKENINQIKQGKLSENLQKYYDQAILSRRLIKLNNQVDLKEVNGNYGNAKHLDIQNLVRKYNFLSIEESLYSLFSDCKKDIHSIKTKDIITQEDLSSFIKETTESGKISLNKEKGNIIQMYNGGNCIYSINSLQVNKVYNIICSRDILKIAFDVKCMTKDISIEIEDINAFDDIMLMSYSLDTTKKTLDEIISEFTDPKIIAIFKAHALLHKRLAENKLFSIYYCLEKPIVKIASKIEKQGMLLNLAKLQNTSQELSLKIKTVEDKIYKCSGTEFNIGSVKQLSKVMFEDLAIPNISKGSTSVEVLESLALNGFVIANYLLEWRKLTKLKNTYTDPLIRNINIESHRVHTQYLLGSTSTGRLSSINPNLQNIPVRDDHSIRECFIAPRKKLLISVDYSQIELRFLTYFANVPEMQYALSQDIHSITAKEIFETNTVTKEMRSKAKSINFGIIYGITPFGLSKQIGCSIEESTQYINRYFEKYPGIKQYMEQCKQNAKNNGYVQTIFGRKCFIHDIKNKNVHARKFAERAAINAPLQGSTADLMKTSMIAIDKKLPEAKMIAQIHDELIFEAEEDIAENIAIKIKNIMESLLKKPPLVVDIKIGPTWANLEKYIQYT